MSEAIVRLVSERAGAMSVVCKVNAVSVRLVSEREGVASVT